METTIRTLFSRTATARSRELRDLRGSACVDSAPRALEGPGSKGPFGGSARWACRLAFMAAVGGIAMVGCAREYVVRHVPFDGIVVPSSVQDAPYRGGSSISEITNFDLHEDECPYGIAVVRMRRPALGRTMHVSIDCLPPSVNIPHPVDDPFATDPSALGGGDVVEGSPDDEQPLDSNLLAPTNADNGNPPTEPSGAGNTIAPTHAGDEQGTGGDDSSGNDSSGNDSSGGANRLVPRTETNEDTTDEDGGPEE